jgi:hypothetical protein
MQGRPATRVGDYRFLNVNPMPFIAAFNVATAFGPIPCNRANSASVILARSVSCRIPALANARRAGFDSLGKSSSEGDVGRVGDFTGYPVLKVGRVSEKSEATRVATEERLASNSLL